MSSISIQESTITPSLTQAEPLLSLTPIIESAIQQRTSLVGAGTISASSSSASSSAITGIVESGFNPEITITPADLAQWCEINGKIKLLLQQILKIPSTDQNHNSSVSRERAERIMRHELLNSKLESELKAQKASMSNSGRGRQ